jgi:two-component system phosphate regulon response regulator PhoB
MMANDLSAKLVLVVEDEPDLQNSLVYNLEQEGYSTRSASGGREALERAFEQPLPNLVLLDLLLPDMRGTEVCRRLRADERTRNVGVIMLTALGEEIDRVVGFEVGADDYVTKPFSVRELMLRVRALLRRRSGRRHAGSSELRGGVLRMDLEGHRVWDGRNEVPMTRIEFMLLRRLMEQPGRVFSREDLVVAIWGIESEVSDRTVDTHIKRLRAKLSAEAMSQIETRRGAGYCFRNEGFQPSDNDSDRPVR